MFGITFSLCFLGVGVFLLGNTLAGLTPSCLPGEVELDDVCVWSPRTVASDLSATFSQCAQQGGQPFTFTSLELLSNARTLLSVDSVELFVPAIKNNYTYRWLSAANSSNTASAAFFSDDVINSDVTGKDCVTVMKSNFTAQDCISDFRFICQRELNSTWNSTCAPTQCAPGSACASSRSSSAVTTQQATAKPLSGADNSSSVCVPQDDGSCVPFDELLIGVLGSLKEGALDDLLNDTGTDLDDVMHGRQTLPGDHHTALSVINLLKASRNRTDVTEQVIKDLDVSNMTHPEAKGAMEAIYDLLVADNSTEEGSDDRVVSLLFKMAYVSSVDGDMLTTFAKSTDLVLYGEGQKPEKEDKKEIQAVRVLQSMERILTTSNVSSLQQDLDQLVMNVVEVNTTQSSDDVILNVRVGDAASILRLSRSLFPSDEGKVSSVVYTDIHRLLPSNRQGALKGGAMSSHVLSLVVHNGIECGGHHFHTLGTGTGIHEDGHDVHDDLDFTFNFTLPRLNPGRPGMDEQRWCVHWKFHVGAWSEDGCWLLEHNLTHTTCTCNHLSTFAVLVTFTKPAQISTENERGMFVLTAIGCSLSIAGLTFTLLTYIYLRILHRERILIHASLALSLLLAQVLFISSDHARDNEVACKIVAALLHFLFMAAFSWMLVEGMALYRTCTRGLLYSSDMRLKYSIIGWGLPLIVVVISLGVEFPNYGRGLQNSCWLSVNKGLIWAFLAPMLVIVSLNVLILCLVIRVFLTLRANSQKTETARARAGLRAMVMLLPLLGTTWLLSLLVPLSSVFGYLFIVCNSLQGLMIFVLHCLSNEEVRRFLALKRGGSRSRTSESNLSVIGWRRRSPALTFDDVKVRIPQRRHCAQNEGRKTAWV